MAEKNKRAVVKEANKDKSLSVRFSQKEYLRVEQNAAESGLTISNWIRKTATRTPSKRRRVIPQINKDVYLELSSALLEIFDFVRLLRNDPGLADLRNGVMERTLVKIVSQIFELKKKLI